MKILQIVTKDHNRSGSGVQMMQLALELDKRGHDVHCFYLYNADNDADFDPYKDSAITLHRVKLKANRFRITALSDIFKLRKFLKEHNFDIIHSHSNSVDQAFLASLGMNIPIVANRGMSSPLKTKNAFKYKTKNINKIIAVAEDVKDVMIKTGGISGDKIDVIYGSVDTERFKPNLDTPITREQFDILETDEVVGYTGSLANRKAFHYLVDAFTLLAREIDNVKLFLVGVTWEGLAEKNYHFPDDVKDKVICVGFQHYPENYMALFDCFVFPGTHGEGLTGAIREASSMGIAVVTTDAGGNRELINQGDCGIVVKIADTQALFNGLKEMLLDDEKRKQYGDNGRRYVAETMSLEHRADQVEKLYKEILSNQKS